MKGPEETDDGDVLSDDEIQQLKELVRPPGPVPKGTHCPDERRLRLLAAGVAEEAEAQQLLAHTAMCAWCGTVMRETIDDLEAPPTEEELALASRSRLADPANRLAFATRLAALTRPVPVATPERRWMPWAAAAAAMASATGVLAVFLWPFSAIMQTERLLARAYTEYRPMEMRLPGAGYGPIRTERGAGNVLPINNSPDLNEAQARILRQTEAHPDDPAWLHLQGRAHLLSGREDDAITELERAKSFRPKDPYILADLGAAWFQKAERSGDKDGDLKSYATAFDFLSQAARLKPNDPALAFNRALAAEHIFAYNEARDAWEAYLRLDPKTPWAAEARAHLDQIKKSPPQSPTH